MSASFVLNACRYCLSSSPRSQATRTGTTEARRLAPRAARRLTATTLPARDQRILDLSFVKDTRSRDKKNTNTRYSNARARAPRSLAAYPGRLQSSIWTLESVLKSLVSRSRFHSPTWTLESLLKIPRTARLV